LGDAAGIAAAVAAHHGIEPSQVDPDEVIKSLLRQNAIVDPPTGTSRWERMKEITK
jgi:hypothetical protein